MVKRHLPGFMLLVFAAGVMTHGEWASAKATGRRLSKILIGKAPAADAERFRRADAKEAEPLFVVIDTPYEIWSGMGSYVHVVAYTPEFKPAAGARVYVNSRPVGVADANGTLVFRNVPRGNDDGYGKSVAVVYEQEEKLHVGWTEFETYRRTESFESAQLFVYTDRGIYNPGQTILIRALAWRLRGDFEPIAEQEVEIQLLDERGRSMGGGRPKTSKYGIASLRLPLPDAMPEGRYTLAIQSGQAREVARLRIERFIPPAIEIKHTLKRFMARAQEKLSFDVTLSAFAGPAPKSGTLEVRAEVDGISYFRRERELKGESRFSFEIGSQELSALKKAVPDGSSFRVLLEATDASGRKDTVKRDMVLTTNPYNAIIETDKDEYAVGEIAKIQVKLTDLDGVPVRGKRVRLVVTRAKAPQPTKSNNSGIALFDLPLRKKSWDQPIEIEAYVDDVEEPLATAELWVIERKPMLSKVRVPVVRERRSVPIEIAIGSGFTPTESFVHGDVVDSSGALVSAFLIPISARGNGWVARGSFKAPTWGTMLLTLFCAAKRGKGDAGVRTVGLLTEGQQITVEPNKALSVTLSGFPKRARPGQRIKVRVRVADSRGRAATAALGVSVVDAAVLSLMNPLEITPTDRFYNPELKVLSTTGSKILTWPVVTRNWGSPRMDIALPPFGFLPGGAPPSRARRAKSKNGGSGGVGHIAMNGGSPDASAQKKPASAMEMAAPSEAPAGGAVGSGEPSAATPVITLRTNFPETALWIDDLVAQGGSASFAVTLPDALTRQAFTVMASDEKGGVGLLRRDLPVVQDVFVRSDFPAKLILGDPVQLRAAVQNLTDRKITATLTLRSTDLDIGTDTKRLLELPAQSSIGAVFEVTPRTLGRATYELNVKAPRIDDTERRELRVLPAGVPVTDFKRGTASHGAAFSAVVEADASTTAAVLVAFPGAGGVVEAFQSLTLDPWTVYESPGSRAVIAYHSLRLLKRQDLLTPERERRLLDAISADMVLLSMLRSDEGGYSYMRTGKSSPYLTGRALEGLSAARNVGFLVNDSIMARAGELILNAVGKEGLVQTHDIAWWEGDGPERRIALTAELFRILAEVGPSAVPKQLRPVFDHMRAAVMRHINLSIDPLTLANVGLGALAYSENFAQTPISDRIANRLVHRLLESRRRGHWEPSWFNAAGGTLEATAAALELVWSLDSIAAEPVVRELTQFLLGARDLFGGWHNASGTAFVVRALAALPLVKETQQASLRINVNGVEVVRAMIDPKDPFGSALAVSRVDITRYLKPGSNEVRVEYGGSLAPTVLVERRRYVEKPPKPPRILVTRTVDRTSIRQGESVEVELKLTTESKVVGALAVEEPIPATMMVDRAFLEASRKQGAIADYRIGERLILYRHGLNRSAEMSYRLVANQPGNAVLGPTVVRPVATPEKAEISGSKTVLLVE